LAGNGAQGLAEYRERAEKIDLVITDMMMPGLGGPELIAALRAIDPRLPIIAISALMDRNEFGLKDVPGAPIVCMTKPIARAALFSAIARLAAKAG